MKYITYLFFIALLASCDYFNKPFVEMESQPEGYAWWLRLHFNPQGREILNIPIQKINKDWCEANEYSQQIFPQKVNEDKDFDLDSKIKSKKFSFALSLLPSAGQPFRASLVAYKKCSGESGSALLILKKEQSQYKVSHSETLDQPGKFAIFSVEDSQHITVWRCFNCGDNISYKWSNDQKQFIYIENGF